MTEGAVIKAKHLTYLFMKGPQWKDMVYLLTNVFEVKKSFLPVSQSLSAMATHTQRIRISACKNVLIDGNGRSGYWIKILIQGDAAQSLCSG